MLWHWLFFFFFFFNDTATTEIYTLSLHDALPICIARDPSSGCAIRPECRWVVRLVSGRSDFSVKRHCSFERNQRCVLRSEEHTSELQSQSNLVCRLLLEKKKTRIQCIALSATTVR